MKLLIQLFSFGNGRSEYLQFWAIVNNNVFNNLTDCPMTLLTFIALLKPFVKDILEFKMSNNKSSDSTVGSLRHLRSLLPNVSAADFTWILQFLQFICTEDNSF